MGALWDYEKSFWKEVFSGCWSFCTKHLRIEILFAVAGLVAGLIVSFIESSFSFLPLFYALISVFVLLALVFLGNLVAAPARIYEGVRKELNETQKERDEYRKQSNQQKENERKVNGLGRIYAEGGDLMSQRVKSESEFSKWKKAKEEWAIKTNLWIMLNTSPTDAQVFTAAPVHGKILKMKLAYNDDHNDCLCQIKYSMEELKKLITRYQQLVY